MPDYALYLTESAVHCREMTKGLRSRGLKKTLLFAMDSLSIAWEPLLKTYPPAYHQTCWPHMARHALDEIRIQDRTAADMGWKAVYQTSSELDAASF